MESQISFRSTCIYTILLLVGVLALASCDNILGSEEQTCSELGALQVIAPQRVRQGDVHNFTAAVCTSSGFADTLSGSINWAMVDSTAGLVDSTGRFVGYLSGGIARVVATSSGQRDTAAIRVEARNISGAFTTLGLGFSPDRYTSDLWVYGDYAYTGTWGCLPGGACGNRLNVWDISNPNQPILVDSVIVDARTVNDIKVSADGRLGILSREGPEAGMNGITLLDLSDPAHPEVITNYAQDLTNGVHNLWIALPYVYVVEDGSGGLHILDISDPAAPVEVAQFYAGSSFVHDVYVRRGLAFVSHWDAGLIILDVGHGILGGSPSNPRVVSRIITNGGNVHNAWYWPQSGYVFVGEENFERPGGMHVVDVTDLTEPVEVASFFLPDTPPHNFWVDENAGILYAAWYSNGLRAIDVSGMLMGQLEKQGREYAAVRPTGPRGGARIWAPQLQRGLVFASDMQNGLWSFTFQVLQ